MHVPNCLLAAALIVLLSSARAQAPAPVYVLNIERQPLVQLLNEFSRQTGLQVIGIIDVAAAARHAQVGPLIGPYTAEAAMSELQARTGLAFRKVNATTIAVTSPTRS